MYFDHVNKSLSFSLKYEAGGTIKRSLPRAIGAELTKKYNVDSTFVQLIA
jgi:hypothetical protein